MISGGKVISTPGGSLRLLNRNARLCGSGGALDELEARSLTRDERRLGADIIIFFRHSSSTSDLLGVIGSQFQIATAGATLRLFGTHLVHMFLLTALT